MLPCLPILCVDRKLQVTNGIYLLYFPVQSACRLEAGAVSGLLLLSLRLSLRKSVYCTYVHSYIRRGDRAVLSPPSGWRVGWLAGWRIARPSWGYAKGEEETKKGGERSSQRAWPGSIL